MRIGSSYLVRFAPTKTALHVDEFDGMSTRTKRIWDWGARQDSGSENRGGDSFVGVAVGKPHLKQA